MTQTAAETTCGAEVGEDVIERHEGWSLKHAVYCGLPIERASDGPCAAQWTDGVCGQVRQENTRARAPNVYEHVRTTHINGAILSESHAFLGRWVHRDRTVEHEAVGP